MDNTPPQPQYPLIQFAPDDDEDAAAPKPIHDENWENNLMDVVLAHEREILSSHEPPIVSSRLTTPLPPPNVSRAADVPLDLNHPARTFPSLLPPVALTHPHGSLYGGPIPYSRRALRAEVADILDTEGIETVGALKRRVKKDIENNKRELVKRMKARKEVLDHNERIHAKLRELDLEREEQIRTEKRWRKEKEHREKKERDANRKG